MNCPKFVTYTVKIVKSLVRVISEHSLKAILVMFETETFGSCLVQKVRGVGWRGGESCLPTPPPPRSYAPVYINHLFVIS